MKKKILIISSEWLDDENTLGSTFELTQAKILQQHFDVAILAVRVCNPFIQMVRTAVKNTVLLRWKLALHSYGQLGRMLTSLIAGKSFWVDECLVEGVQVYSGTGFSLGYIKSNESFYKTWTSAGLGTYARYAGHMGRPELAHAHGRFLVAGLLALALKEREGIPYVYTEHSSRFPSGFVPANDIVILNRIVDSASRYIAVSKALLEKVGETLDREIPRASVIPNVLDPVFLSPVQKKLPNKPFIFLNIASLEHRKGIDILLRAFKRAFHADPGFQLIIIGDGPERQELEQLTTYLDLVKLVTYKGICSKEEVAATLDACHVFVFPSRFETFGVSVIEAMARGCPVIVTACGGPEYIVESAQGLVILPENENELVVALGRIVNQFTTYDMDAIATYAVEKFGGASFLRQLTDLYNEVLTESNN
jgi:L-malate glycosyltransferase